MIYRTRSGVLSPARRGHVLLGGVAFADVARLRDTDQNLRGSDRCCLRERRSGGAGGRGLVLGDAVCARFVPGAARETTRGQQEAGRLDNETVGAQAGYPVATSPASYKAICPSHTTVAFNPDRICPNLFPVAT
jgi:hypothetical protein